MKSLRKKLFLSILAVAFAVVSLATSTFAWFSMNNRVTVTGMQVNTKVANNLFIAPSALGTTAKENDANFKTSMTTTVAPTLIEPVSTINGVNYFYHLTTNNVAGDGSQNDNTYTAYASGDAFDTNYGVNTTPSTPDAYGFVDYVFQLKAENTNADTYYVNLSTLELVYGGATQNQKAFRVAIFVWDMGEEGSTAAGSDVAVGNLKSILAPAESQYFSGTNAASAVDNRAAVSELGTAANIGSVEGGHKNFYKVVVRLWLEGEDKTCNNTTFAALNDNWMLNLAVTFDAATGGVTALNQSLTAEKLALSIASVTLGSVKLVDGISYTAISGKHVDSLDLYVLTSDITDSKITAASHFYVFDTNNKPTDVTNKVTVGA